MSNPDQVWRSAALSEKYLEGIRGAIPFAQEQIETIQRLTHWAQPSLRCFLDLGCGDGVLGRALLAQAPEAKGVFLDFSESMLAAARRRVGLLSASAQFVSQDYGQPEWVETVRALAPFDVIVSGFSIHHQPDERKKALYAEIFGLLTPGGLFLNLEHVSSATRWGERIFDEFFIEALCRYHRAQGSERTRESVAVDYYHRPDKAANILAPVVDQCQWLREVGFEHVDCFFKVLELALFGGLRPK